MTAARDQILQTTGSLLERQGYHATAMSEILQTSGAPKGSLYYYFPGGKEELAEAAIRESARAMTGHIRANLSLQPDPLDAIPNFVRRIADRVEAAEFSAGGPLTAVAMETAADGGRLNLACRAAFGEIEAVFAEKLSAAGGCPADTANRLAVFITAAIDGGVLLSRTAHSGDPLRTVADLLELTLRSALSTSEV